MYKSETNTRRMEQATSRVVKMIEREGHGLWTIDRVEQTPATDLLPGLPGTASALVSATIARDSLLYTSLSVIIINGSLHSAKMFRIFGGDETIKGWRDLAIAISVMSYRGERAASYPAES